MYPMALYLLWGLVGGAALLLLEAAWNYAGWWLVAAGVVAWLTSSYPKENTDERDQ